MLTWPLTINSARIKFISHPPPIRNEMLLPLMLKNGEVRVPWGPSPWIPPGGAVLEGRSSNPPIHQSPCWLAGCPLLRAEGLSPYVGWLLNTVPVFSQPSIPSSKSNLQTLKKGKKKEKFSVGVGLRYYDSLVSRRSWIRNKKKFLHYSMTALFYLSRYSA